MKLSVCVLLFKEMVSCTFFKEINRDGLVSLFHGISTFMNYSIQKPSLWKNSSNTTLFIAGR